MVILDIAGVRLEIPAAAVAALRDAAARDAGRSSARRDLSLVLERALQTRSTVALHPAEARELRALLVEQPPSSALAELSSILEEATKEARKRR